MRRRVDFSPADRGHLEKELKKILRTADDDQLAQYLAAAEWAIFYYVRIATVAERELRPEQWDQVVKAGQAFIEAVHAAVPPVRSLIARTQVIAVWGWGPNNIAELDQMLEAAKQAELTIEAVARATEGGGRRKELTSWAMSRLIEDLAVAYDQIFGEQPSAARNGHFMRATALILKAADLPTIGENAARPILKRAPLHAPRPRRGTKPGRPVK